MWSFTRPSPALGGIVHTHSRWATTFAQAGLDIPAMGTTHGDYFYGDIPCTRKMTPQEIAGSMKRRPGASYRDLRREVSGGHTGCDGAPHGPFAWGKDAMDAVHNAVVMEEVAFMDWHAMMINPAAGRMQQELLDKHYLRKHGKNAYYGQGLRPARTIKTERHWPGRRTALMHSPGFSLLSAHMWISKQPKSLIIHIVCYARNDHVLRQYCT